METELTVINQKNMHKLKVFLLIAVVGLVIGSCTNLSQNGQMDKMIGVANKTQTSPGAAKITSFERSVDGLDNAKPSQEVSISDGQTYQLDAKPVVKAINGNPIRMYGYNGQIPGPVIKVRQGSTIYVNFTNNAEFETTIHWHGLRNDNRFDGVSGLTQDPVKQGESFLYKLSFPDAGIFWYHPHIREDLEQELGLYANIIVEPKDNNYYNKVDKEVPLFLDDIKLNGNDADFNSIMATFTFMGRFGNVLLLNGETSYNLDVSQGDIVRFYLTDSANARPFNFGIESHKLKLIGSDLGKYEKETFVDSVIISPGERYIVEVKFDNAGEYKIMHKTPSNTYIMGKINVGKSNYTGKNKDFEILKENKDVESDINNYRKYFDANPDYEFKLTLNQSIMQSMRNSVVGDGIEWEDTGHMAMMNRNSDTNNVKWIIQDVRTRKENLDINYEIKKGDVKKIRIFNDPNSMHPMQHPIHMHGQRFLVLNGSNDNLVWKDTVLVPSGKTVDLIVDFSNAGSWMMHCHIAEHLEAGMMSMFKVV